MPLCWPGSCLTMCLWGSSGWAPSTCRPGASTSSSAPSPACPLPWPWPACPRAPPSSSRSAHSAAAISHTAPCLSTHSTCHSELLFAFAMCFSLPPSPPSFPPSLPSSLPPSPPPPLPAQKGKEAKAVRALEFVLRMNRCCAVSAPSPTVRRQLSQLASPEATKGTNQPPKKSFWKKVTVVRGGGGGQLWAYHHPKWQYTPSLFTMRYLKSD